MQLDSSQFKYSGLLSVHVDKIAGNSLSQDEWVELHSLVPVGENSCKSVPLLWVLPEHNARYEMKSSGQDVWKQVENV